MLRLLSKITPQPSEEAQADGVLVHQVQRGEAGASSRLFAKHRASVQRFLRDLLRNVDWAEEAVQETFARAHGQLAQFGQHERFKPWLLGIARNVAFEMRRVRRHESLDNDESSDNDSLPDAVIPAPNPEQVLLDKELSVHFSKALESLGTERKAALLMRIDHGLTYEEIGQSFGWSLPTVKNEIHRARLKLRNALLPHL